MRFLVLSTILTLAAPCWVHAGETLTLPAAIRGALTSSPEVGAAEATANAAANRARKAKGSRFPRLDLTESYSRTDNPAEVFALQLNQERFDMESFFLPDPNDPAALDTGITRLEVQQPVYTGGKLGARIDQGSLMATAEELTLGHVRESVTFATVTAFVNLAKAREHVGLLRTARETTAEHLKLARAYAEQGIILDAEVLKAVVYLAEVDEMLAQAGNASRLAEAALNFQMGSDQMTARNLAGIPQPPPVAGELESLISAALGKRRDLLAAQRMLEAGRLEEKVERSGFLPEVAVIGRYDLYDDNAFGSHGDSTALMAVARINLFRGGADRAGLAAARQQTTAFEQDLRRFEDGVTLEVRQAWHDLITARARHDTAASALAAAREALRVREQRFGQGLDRMIDLLDAETALREAELRELVARYDIVLGSYRLLFTTGSSLIESMEESR